MLSGDFIKVVALSLGRATAERAALAFLLPLRVIPSYLVIDVWPWTVR
jgi:hypothetical protein